MKLRSRRYTKGDCKSACILELGWVKSVDIYSGFNWNPYDAKVGKGIIEREGTPEAIKYFSEVCEGLTNYGYWFFFLHCG